RGCAARRLSWVTPGFSQSRRCKTTASEFSGSKPTQLYMDILSTVIKEGDVLAPRGKRIKEIRPVMIEFKNPIRRTTFLKGRNINPFFQVAESLWILAGRSDVGFLLDYNKNMGQFSDDGVFFNAPYGRD
ncbi:hypothetical protein Q6A64_08305, partial [Helicobacter pylori]|uniref:hypothetical protein n=1 Tax=Helicobacter pylori TaxID=210 RepID=UPI001A9E5525